MKTRELGLLVLLVSLAMMSTVSARADFILSGNVLRAPGASVFPGNATTEINTGATYTYLTDTDTTNYSIGNTDSAFISQDSSLTKLTDGYNERVGSASAVYGTYSGQYGATILFDLQSVYQIDTVSVSVNMIGTNTGVGTFEVFTSTDGINFTSLGTWDGSTTVLDAGQSDAGRNTEISISASALSDARYVEIFLSNWNADHTSRLYKQLDVGEVAIYGDVAAIPEPSTCALLAGAGVLGFIVVRRLRRRAG